MQRPTRIATDRVTPESTERGRVWERFALAGGDAPELGPVVRDSWLRSRNLHRIDPAIERSPIVLTENDLTRRRERLAPLRLGLPFLEQLSDGLCGTRHRQIGPRRGIRKLGPTSLMAPPLWSPSSHRTARHRGFLCILRESYSRYGTRWRMTQSPSNPSQESDSLISRK
jgi:hypothetical protein